MRNQGYNYRPGLIMVSFWPLVSSTGTTADCELATKHGRMVMKEGLNQSVLDGRHLYAAVDNLWRTCRHSWTSCVEIEPIFKRLRLLNEAKFATRGQHYCIPTQRSLTKWKRWSAMLRRCTYSTASMSSTHALIISSTILCVLNIYQAGSKQPT